jgi:hypothetical protein
MGATAALPTLPTLPVAKPTVLPGTPTTGTAPAATIPGVAPSSTGQGTGVGTIAVPTTGISSSLSTTDGSNTLVGDFKDTYGNATGTALADTIANLGTATDAAVTTTNQSILNAAGIQQANLEATDAAHGVSADSSSAALSLGDFNSQVSQQIATTDSQMELSEENTLISALQDEGTAHGPSSSFMGSLSDFLSGGGLSAISGGASAAENTTGAGGALGTTLDILAGL